MASQTFGHCETKFWLGSQVFWHCGTNLYFKSQTLRFLDTKHFFTLHFCPHCEKKLWSSLPTKTLNVRDKLVTHLLLSSNLWDILVFHISNVLPLECNFVFHLTNISTLWDKIQDHLSKFPALWYQIVIQITNITTPWDKIVILVRQKIFDTVSQKCISLVKPFGTEIQVFKSNHKFYHTVRQNCLSFSPFNLKFFDTASQICNSPLSFFDIVSQTCKSDIKSFGLVIWKCNSTHKDFETLRQKRDRLLQQNLWHCLTTLSFISQSFRHCEKKIYLQSHFCDTVIQNCKSTQQDFDNVRQTYISNLKTFSSVRQTWNSNLNFLTLWDKLVIHLIKTSTLGDKNVDYI